MTKADKRLIICIMILSFVLLIPIIKNAPQSESVVVTVQNKEVLRVNLNENQTYTVQGTQGDVVIEIKDGKVRVSQETSQYHLCSKQGYVSDSNVPIVCLPNETVVQIEGNETKEDTVIE